MPKPTRPLPRSNASLFIRCGCFRSNIQATLSPNCAVVDMIYLASFFLVSPWRVHREHNPNHPRSVSRHVQLFYNYSPIRQSPRWTPISTFNQKDSVRGVSIERVFRSQFTCRPPRESSPTARGSVTRLHPALARGKGPACSRKCKSPLSSRRRPPGSGIGFPERVRQALAGLRRQVLL
jgi:hypothetical protein